MITAIATPLTLSTARPRTPEAPLAAVPADVFAPAPETVRVEVSKTGQRITGGLLAAGGGVLGFGLTQALPTGLRVAAGVAGAVLAGGLGLHLGQAADGQRAIRGTLGIEMDDLTPPTVTRVHPHSLGSVAGLQAGDTLLQVGPHDLAVTGGIHDRDEDNNSVLRHPFENRLVDTLHDNLDGCYLLARRGEKTVGLHFPKIELE